jgi:hypothetical protein
MSQHSQPSTGFPAYTSTAPVLTIDALMTRLADGPVTVENLCAGCEGCGCVPERCGDARQFERLVDELQTLEERGLVRLWLHNVYSARPNARAMVRVRLTDAGREEYAAAS